MADSQTFLVIHDCVQNTSLAVDKGYYIVTAVTADGETPMCPAVQNGWAPNDHPPVFPTPTMACVNYYLTNTTATRSDFTWDAYPDALGYNVYAAPIADPTNFTLYRDNIPLSVLEIADQAIIVTAITPFGETPKCAAIEFTSSCAELTDYLTRVAANGGIEPPIEEQIIVCDFISGMKDAGLWDKMFGILYFSNNGRNTALTWLKQGPFDNLLANTWRAEYGAYPTPTNLQLVTVDGFDNAGVFFDTTVAADSLWTLSNFGFSCYASKPYQFGTPEIMGTSFSARKLTGIHDGYCQLAPWKPYTMDPVFGLTWASCYVWDSGYAGLQTQNGTQFPEQNTNKGCGFLSLNRLDLVTAKIYYAASNKPLAALKSDSIHSNGAQMPDGNIRLFSDDAQGNEYYGSHSFMAFHEGLTEAEAATLFSLVQALRVALGGGYV